MYEYVRRFGFGQRTNLSLPGESAGLLRKLPRWGKTSLSSIAMGHEVSTTSVQLAQACSAIANGGLLVKPRLILRKGDAVVAFETPGRVLRTETAASMREMMEGVVLHGTGRRAQLDGYSTGGKTGSAQIFDFASRRYTHNYNASFIGFAPVSRPAIVVAVTVNGTRGGTAGFGGAVAAPVFKTVAAEALRVLDIPKDLPDPPKPDLKEEKSEDVNDLAIAELAKPESPEAVEPMSATASPSPSPATEPDGPTTPDFRGMSMRAVLAEASSKGLQVLVDGSGIARLQNPPAGAALNPGQPIRVRFAR
jgi:cell division protein FtsI (penicillin-binding protein 3)